MLPCFTWGCTKQAAVSTAPPANTTSPARASAPAAENAARQPGAQGESAEAGSETENTPAKSDDVVAISFDDLICSIQPDIQFRPWMLTPRAKELDGRRIRVSGYMLPDLKQKGIKEFVFLRNTECKFGPGGQADHLIRVTMRDGATADYRGNKSLEITGRLKINPFEGPDGNTWCIYDLDCESVSWNRR